MRKKFVSVFVALSLIFVLLWLRIQILGIKDTSENYFFNLYSVIPIFGAFCGWLVATKFGDLKSTLGRAILMITAGLLLWGLGGFVWLWYNLVLMVPVPQPSLADYLFFPAYIFWAFGTIYLAKAAGIKYFILGGIAGKLILTVVPVLVGAVVVAFYFFLRTGGPIDLLPYSTFALLLVYSGATLSLLPNLHGGQFFKAVGCLILGFFILYIAAMSFSYSVVNGTYYNGHFADLFFALGFAAIGTGVALFYPD